ncbi:glucosylceramidase-like [Ceratina calcarata]|uniref:Glucosylceramidase n=1 Tax=Ceratina calcarata TaxID=156304 RepID=A0AAJ7ISJ0_9HYME|nr:glucosylceramidase-like [Ceratina calcarata]
MWRILLLITFFFDEGTANDCVPYRVDGEIVACVCNATYCDGPFDDVPEVPKEGSSHWFMSNKQGDRMKMSQLEFGDCKESPKSQVLSIDTSKKYQTIIGFGGAFTDAVGINLLKLSPATQDQLLRAYYDRKKGSRYSLARVPIAGVDASTRPYSYDDVPNDVKLEHFALTIEDYDYKIPYLKKALDLNPDTKFLSAAWTAPQWMKFTEDDISGLTFLSYEYYKTYADYLIKFLDEYKKMGIDMWAISTGNEPLTALTFDVPLTSMGWMPESMADWVGNYFGPALAASSHNETLILAMDDNRSLLPWFVQPTLKCERSNKYVGGIAVHWYQDYLAEPDVLDEIHNEFPNKFILVTESSITTIWNTSQEKVGSWQHGERYILTMIEYLNHWTVGWVDWNIALDTTGGPNWQEVYLDAAIIVNPEADEFYKQPSYYAMQHFSRFVDRGSIRTSITDTDAVKSSAFLTPSGNVAVVLYNRNDTAQHVILKDSQKRTLCFDLPPQSMNTLIYH